MRRRSNHEGTFEKLPGGRVRLVKQINGKRIAGPISANRIEAKKAWNAKQNTPKKPENEFPISVGAEIYFRLYGVYEAESTPSTVGPWKHELAGSTYDLYKTVWKAHIKRDPIATMLPEDIDRSTLEAFRSRLLSKVGVRSTLRYMTPVVKVLRMHKNNVADDLDELKLPRIVKGLLKRKDKAAFLALFPDHLKTAVIIMLHGVTVSEVCGLLGRHFDGTHLTIEEQYNMVGGKGNRTNDLKRPRRYRKIPCTKELRRRLKGREADAPIIESRPGKPYQRWSLARAIARKVEGTAFEGITPHDLRSSGGKWMLDEGAKLSDVAAILGNDPRVLLQNYDQSDEAGMLKAISAV
jgi:integrase